MCGIAGVFRFDSKTVTVRELKLMTDSMIQRGPDDDGFYAEGSVGIAMRRLSIIDVSGGHQPLTNEDNTLHLVMNGEIYNYIELREELIKKGHHFSTGSDAEIILHLYEEKGFKALEDLNGMFAFALYDSIQKTLWVGRDRLGIKPFFYVRTKDYFIFSSDIKSLRQYHSSRILPEQVLKYISLGYTPETQTLWDGISKLLPGHHALIRETGEVIDEEYWRITNFGTWEGSNKHAEEQLAELLYDSVRLQLRTDVPFGVFLSGGLDSSALVALAAGQLREPLKTFTIDFEDKESGGDAFFAKEVSKRYGTEHFNLKMTSTDAAKALDDIVKLIDEPLADSALLPVYVLSRYAREQGIKVLLNGAGGDEIFGGYARHWHPRLGSPAWVSENVPQPFRKMLATTWALFQPQRGLRASDPRLAWGVCISGVDLSAVKSILKEADMVTSVSQAIYNEHNSLLEKNNTNGSYAYQRMLMDIKHYLPDNILSLTDKATMAASVEGRVPLLDHRLVEFAFSLSPEVNLLNNSPKGLFKKVATSWLPSELFNRKKEGFNPPDKGWFGGNLKDKVADELLGNPTNVLSELINPEKLERLLKNPSRSRHAATTLYTLYLFNRWYRNQDVY